MNIIKKLMMYITNKNFRFNINSRIGLYNHMNDEEYIRRQYKIKTGKELNLRNPVRFNEKLEWLKLHNRKDEYSIMVDKYAVKSYLAPIIGEEHIVPLLGVWDKFEDINFDELPDSYVLKTTHGCGGMFINRGGKIDEKKVKHKFQRALKRNYYYHAREWPYKNVKPRIIAEQYLQDGENIVLTVYKVFCFSGNPYLIQTIQNDKTKDETVDYYTIGWKKLDIKQNYPNSKVPMHKPNNLELILKLSSKCSAGVPFLRTDWYEVNGQAFFSEFTFFSDGGHEPFYPDGWDFKLGELIDLGSIAEGTEVK